MAVKNFHFRKNWVGCEVADMKKAFFPIFDPIWTHILPPAGPNIEFLKHNSNFQFLRKTCYNISNYVTLGLTY